MRSLVVLAALSSVPALAAPAPPQCALPPGTAILAADHTQQATSDQPQPTPVLPARPAAIPPLPDALSGLSFVRHVAGAGAVISDLGASHGLRSIAARSGDRFMVFQVTPDGDAAVSGAITDLTPLQMQTIAAGNINNLGTQHGLDTLFVRSGGQFQVLYVSPDNERLIPGVMWDSSGKDLTRDQVSKVPGAVPTVLIGSGNNDQPLAPTAPGGADLPLVEKASAGAEGPSTAPHLWMLVDPQCIYSIRAMQMLQPYVVSGRLQLSVVPLSVLDYEDKGQSTRSALALLSKPADKIIAAWQSGDVGGAPGPEANQRLAANMAIAHSIGLRGTPTLVWRKPDGTEGRIDGVPTSIDALLASMGS